MNQAHLIQHDLIIQPIVAFYKVDVDKNKDASQAAGIQCMPTFIAYKGGAEADKLEGASEDALTSLVTNNQ